MVSELLQQVRVLDPMSETDRVADVLIADGMVTAVDATIAPPEGAIVRDCCGLVLAPGLVDLYSHSGEPGFEERETLESLLLAGAAGGFTRLTVLPDTAPAVDNPASLAWFQAQTQAIRARLSSPLPQLLNWGAATLGTQGQQMTELVELAHSGATGFSDGRPLTNSLLLRRLLEYIKPLQKPLALWCCDPTLATNGVMREGIDSIQFGLPGVPAIAETTALATVLECVAAFETPVHLMRISTARSVELIRAAKDQGLPVTASTTWMHLLLNSSAINSYNPSLHLDPPLGSRSDQMALRQACQDGILDAIAIDHTPYTYEEKTVAFAEAPAGAIGLELALPLLWQTLVLSGEWTALDLWRSLSTKPSQCLGQTPAAISPGKVAEMVLFDPNQFWLVSAETLKSRSLNTPWLGQKVMGHVVKVWAP